MCIFIDEGGDPVMVILLFVIMVKYGEGVQCVSDPLFMSN